MPESRRCTRQSDVTQQTLHATSCKDCRRYLTESGFDWATVVLLQRPKFTKNDFASEGDLIKILEPRQIRQPTNVTNYSYPSLGLGVDIAARVQLMDPEDPAHCKQLFAKLTGRLRLSEHVNLWARYEQNFLTRLLYGFFYFLFCRRSELL